MQELENYTTGKDTIQFPYDRPLPKALQAAVPHMKAQGFGRVVNASSTAGRMVSTLGGAHYTASKTGLLGLTRAAAKELGKY